MSFWANLRVTVPLTTFWNISTRTELQFNFNLTIKGQKWIGPGTTISQMSWILEDTSMVLGMTVSHSLTP